MMMRILPLTTLTLLACMAGAPLCAAEKGKPTAARKWADYLEPGVPYVSSVLDARKHGGVLTPRGLLLNLGHSTWACVDVDLLTVACIWQAADGAAFDLVALAPRSYQDPGQKTKDGQNESPTPRGKILLTNGTYPGFQQGEKPQLTDPREPTASPEEVGRGGMQDARLLAVRTTAQGTELHCMVHGQKVTTQLRVQDGAVLWEARLVEPKQSLLWVQDQEHSVRLSPEQPSAQRSIPLPQKKGAAPPALAAGSVTTHAELSPSKAAFVADHVAMPWDNPWKRNVRLADIAFLDDQGHAAAVTYDGDVWLLSGLVQDLKEVQWARYATGLHEPMSLVARRNAQGAAELFVYDRNGLWQLVDADGDGRAEEHRLHCGLFGQTAETREFPNSLKLGPDGSFYLCKGGQQGTTLGKHNGSVLRVAPDGQSYEVVATGLRQPFIGVSEKTGLITASDQQGDYVPSTPLHIIYPGSYYGYIPSVGKKEQYPTRITEPLTWLPHPVNPSAASQVWLHGAKMGPLNDALLHLAYSRPGLIRVMMDSHASKTQPQAAAIHLPLSEPALRFAPLNGKVNPADGSLYVVGFQIWGSIAEEVSGLARVRYTGAESTLPAEVSAMKQGVLLSFDSAVDRATASDPQNYVLGRWNYKRTPDYGSPHFTLEGSTGQELHAVSSAYVSADGKRVFLGIPNMKPCHQLDIGWKIRSATGAKMEQNAYSTPWALHDFTPGDEGFPTDLKVDLTPRKMTVATVQASLEEGQRLYQFIGCMGCHSVDGSVAGKLGPSWKGLYGSKRKLADGHTVTADDAYLKESIIDPSKKKVKDYLKLESGMPIYAGILNDGQIESLILYIKSLK